MDFEDTRYTTRPDGLYASDDYINLSNLLHPLYVPKILQNNKMYLICVGKHFKCTLCDAILMVSSDPSITIKNFLQHLNGNAHYDNLQEESMSDVSTDDFDYLTSLLEPLYVPKILQNNRGYLNYEGQHFKCTLCDAILMVSSDPLITIKEFSKHLNGEEHYDKLHDDEDRSSDMSTDDLDYLIDDLLHPLGAPELLYENKMYLICEGKHFKCTLCDATLLVSSDPSITIQNFLQHLNGNLHYKNLQTSEEDSTSESSTSDDFCHLENLLYPLQVPEVLLENRMYLSYEGKHFKCTLCDVTLLVSSEPSITIFEFSKHLNGRLHDNNLQDEEYSSDMSCISDDVN